MIPSATPSLDAFLGAFTGTDGPSGAALSVESDDSAGGGAPLCWMCWVAPPAADATAGHRAA